MRDLVFKNLTSNDRKRKIIATCEVSDKQGIHSVINRHFVCIVKQVSGAKIKKPAPYLYVLKEHNTKEQKERFFCKVKGSVLTIYENKVFLVSFMHSLRINLTADSPVKQ